MTGWSWTHVVEIAAGIILGALIVGVVARRQPAVGGLAGAWVAGMAITSWRQIRASSHLPVPASLEAVTGLFLVLGLLADISPRARPVITAAAWGLVVAGALRVLPAGLFQETQQAIQAEQQATPPLGSTGSGTATPGGFSNTAPITTM